MTSPANFPAAFFLDPADLNGLEAFLGADARRLAPGETLLGAERAGEGNMNCTVRVRTSARTFIVKQARPWLEKYPQIAAPFDRTRIEGRFYTVVQAETAVAGRMPGMLWIDEAACVLALEDLGAASDFFPIYSGGAVLGEETLHELIEYLGALHAMTIREEDRAALVNQEMRALNHEHIFALPLRADNGLDLDAYTGTPGLSAAALVLRTDAAYQRQAAALGERYLHGAGPSLLHGDFFPGSFLKTAAGVRVIDPEFCFCGDAEFDVGVLAAHLLLAGEPQARAEGALERYARCAHGAFSPERARQYAGIEIMRRLLGVAQIPTLSADLARKIGLLQMSREMVLNPGRDCGGSSQED